MYQAITYKNGNSENLAGERRVTEIFDAAVALEQAGGNEELARDLFSMLLEELPSQQASIKTACKRVCTENAATETLWDPVHKLHGSTAYLGVPALSEAVKAFEDEIKQDNRAQFAEAFKRLDSEIRRLLEQGREILGRSW